MGTRGWSSQGSWCRFSLRYTLLQHCSGSHLPLLVEACDHAAPALSWNLTQGSSLRCFPPLGLLVGPHVPLCRLMGPCCCMQDLLKRMNNELRRQANDILSRSNRATQFDIAKVSSL